MSLLLILTLLFHLNSTVLPSPTDSNIALSDVTLTYQFGKSIDIEANLEDFQSVDQVNVILQTDSGAKVKASGHLSPTGALTCHVDLSDNPFKVFDRIYYWFEFADKAGNTTVSPSYWFDYLDNRFSWQKSESRWFDIYTINSSALSGNELQEISLDALRKATAIIPVSPALPIQLFVYPDAGSLSSALGITSQEWAAGEARPELGVIMVSASDHGESLSELQRQIPHELTHMLEYSITGNNYTSAPKWLLEGLASRSQGDISAENKNILKKAYQSGSLIPMQQLCSSFPPDTSQSAIAYAESISFVTYLTDTYGGEELISLLRRVGDSTTCDQLVVSGYGKDLPTLQSEWVGEEFNDRLKKTVSNEYWLLLLMIPLVFLSLWLVKRHGAGKKKAENQ